MTMITFAVLLICSAVATIGDFGSAVTRTTMPAPLNGNDA